MVKIYICIFISINLISISIKTFQRYPTDRAYFIAKEILMTERTYKKDLEIINLVSDVIKYVGLYYQNTTLLHSGILYYHILIQILCSGFGMKLVKKKICPRTFLRFCFLMLILSMSFIVHF